MRWLRTFGFVFASGCAPSFSCGGFDWPDMATIARCPEGTADGRACQHEGDVCALDSEHDCSCGYATWSCDFSPDLAAPERD